MWMSNEWNEMSWWSDVRSLIIVVVIRYEEVILLEESRHFLRDRGAEIEAEWGDEEHFEEAGVRSPLRLRSEVKARLLSLIIDEVGIRDGLFSINYKSGD